MLSEITAISKHVISTQLRTTYHLSMARWQMTLSCCRYWQRWQYETIASLHWQWLCRQRWTTFGLESVVAAPVECRSCHCRYPTTYADDSLECRFRKLSQRRITKQKLSFKAECRYVFYYRAICLQ